MAQQQQVNRNTTPINRGRPEPKKSGVKVLVYNDNKGVCLIQDPKKHHDPLRLAPGANELDLEDFNFYQKQILQTAGLSRVDRINEGSTTPPAATPAPQAPAKGDPKASSNDGK